MGLVVSACVRSTDKRVLAVPLWIPYAALLAQIVVATLITILLLRWQDRRRTLTAASRRP
jgi:hypothetical protein